MIRGMKAFLRECGWFHISSNADGVSSISPGLAECNEAYPGKGCHKNIEPQRGSVRGGGRVVPGATALRLGHWVA